MAREGEGGTPKQQPKHTAKQPHHTSHTLSLPYTPTHRMVIELEEVRRLSGYRQHILEGGHLEELPLGTAHTATAATATSHSHAHALLPPPPLGPAHTYRQGGARPYRGGCPLPGRPL